MSRHSVSNDDNDCMICLFPLLENSADESKETADNCSSSGSGTNNEIGAVFPCGHVFHLTCWRKWNRDKCPVCNQAANLFSKIFISAPSNSNSNSNHQQQPSRDLSSSERQELERFRRLAREDERQEKRMLLCDMEKRVQEDPQGAKTMMTMMMMVQSRELRKTERELHGSKQECQETKEILQVVRTELDDALDKLAQLKNNAASLQQEVHRLKKSRREAASHKTDEYKQQIKDLQQKLDRATEKLALKNKQLSRRNKELAAKKKVITDTKLELASKGLESQKVSKKTMEELQRTKKELELLRELDSFTLSESFSSYGHGSFNESLSWLD
jgi:DNA repair exonuclease SbcCD ATPase subunit